MKHILFIAKFYCLLITPLWFNSCKKSHTPINITLYDKPLSVIQQNIQGKWKLIYGKGGIATVTQYYHDNFWEFNDDRIKIASSGSIVADTTINWDYNIGTYTNGDSTFLLNFYDKVNVPWVYVVERIYNDTLILHDNSSDAFFYHFIKSN